MISYIKGEIAEKRIYAKNRLISEMYKDDCFGVPKCGTIEDVQKITGLYDSDFAKAPVLSVLMPTAEKQILSTHYAHTPVPGKKFSPYKA